VIEINALETPARGAAIVRPVQGASPALSNEIRRQQAAD
jgi:hypothetical protein|tara:strand:- start:3152 stop:3268 length:117 start_codon:yes stop_codon:yes gene_type:complete